MRKVLTPQEELCGSGHRVVVRVRNDSDEDVEHHNHDEGDEDGKEERGEHRDALGKELRSEHVAVEFAQNHSNYSYDRVGHRSPGLRRNVANFIVIV